MKSTSNDTMSHCIFTTHLENDAEMCYPGLTGCDDDRTSDNMTLHQMLFYSCVLHCWYLLSSPAQNFRRCAFYSAAHVGSRTAGHEINSRHCIPLKGPREVDTNIFCISLQSRNCNSFKTIDCTLACLYLSASDFFFIMQEKTDSGAIIRITFYTIMT